MIIIYAHYTPLDALQTKITSTQQQRNVDFPPLMGQCHEEFESELIKKKVGSGVAQVL
jgi:hypothetical protein